MSTRLLVLVVVVVLGLVACGSDEPADSGRPVVVATTTQLGDIVREVAGDGADVHQILEPNSDPHEYEPRPQDIRATAGAKVVFESGGGLDDWMHDVVSAAGGDATQVTLDPPHKLRDDPHWWHDPRNVEAAVDVIRDALVKAQPAMAETFRRNADSYRAELRRLDADIRACMDQVPAQNRKLVTSHDAFGYFTARYGITVVGAIFPSLSTRAQPSAAQIADLAALVRREHVKAVFPESSINPKLAQALARETGARSDLELYGDSLGPAGSSGDTYLKMERANADAMVRGFTGGARGC